MVLVALPQMHLAAGNEIFIQNENDSSVRLNCSAFLVTLKFQSSDIIQNSIIAEVIFREQTKNPGWHLLIDKTSPATVTQFRLVHKG